MGELTKLVGIGKVVEAQLNEIGITSHEELKEMGSRQAWLKIRENDQSACVNRLLGMEGAIRGIKKKELPEEIKQEIREFVREVRKAGV